MTRRPLPPAQDLNILFAHVAYRFGERFALRNTGLHFKNATSLDELKAAAGDAHVLVCSGLWRNELVDLAPRLAFVQSCSAGTDQYDKPLMAAKGVRLASAQGVNERAVAEHLGEVARAPEQAVGDPEAGAPDRLGR